MDNLNIKSSGKSISERYQMATTFIIRTETDWTIASRISNYSHTLTTHGFIGEHFLRTVAGSRSASIVAKSKKSMKKIGIFNDKDET